MAEKAKRIKKKPSPIIKAKSENADRREKQAILIKNFNILLDSRLFTSFEIVVTNQAETYLNYVSIPITSQVNYEKLEVLMQLAEENNWLVHITDRTNRPTALEIWFPAD